MIPDQVGQKLHDRVTRGEALTDEERGRLRDWYARLDQEEMTQLSAAPAPNPLSDIQTRVQQATAQVVARAQRIEVLTAENAQLRQEIASSQRALLRRVPGC